jgi:hypothetical protein
MSIQLNKPYIIIPTRMKRYGTHYKIPAENALVVPVKAFDNEVLCDIHWEDGNGELQVIHNAMFVAENLAPLNPMLNEKLYELWSHFYGTVNKTQDQ